MISVWWVLVAFVGGGCAGTLVMALMRMSADLPEQSMQEPRSHTTTSGSASEGGRLQTWF